MVAPVATIHVLNRPTGRAHRHEQHPPPASQDVDAWDKLEHDGERENVPLRANKRADSCKGTWPYSEQTHCHAA